MSVNWFLSLSQTIDSKFVRRLSIAIYMSTRLTLQLRDNALFIYIYELLFVIWFSIFEHDNYAANICC